MPNGTIRTLRIRPSQSADLSFNMPGVIAEQNFDTANGQGTAHLGRTVSAFDIAAGLYRRLGETLPAGGGIEADARLRFDAAAIRDVLTQGNGGPAPFLFTLRNEALAAALDQMIDRREIAFLEKFKHAAAIRDRLQASFPAMLDRLRNLLDRVDARFRALDEEYARDGISIRKESRTVNQASADYKVKTSSKARTPAMAMWNTAMSGDAPTGTHLVTEVKDQGGQVVQRHEVLNTASIPRLRDGGGAWRIVDTPTFESQTMDSEMVNEGHQVALTEAQQYSHPRLDNEIAHDQMKVSLHNELIRQEMASFRTAHVERILENELRALDQEIRALQVNYAHTFLFTPFAGVVTAVYKDLGESVEPGEPVIRVENDRVVYAVGQVQFRGLLRLGSQIAIVATDLFESGREERFAGTVVSIRGHQADDDEWDVIIEVPNPLDGNERLLPLNYQFDPDSTHIEV